MDSSSLGGRYSTAGKKGLFVSIINIKFNMQDFPDLGFSNTNKNILPFKDFFDDFESLSLPWQKNLDYHVNVSYSGFDGIFSEVEKRKSKYGCLAVFISSHGHYKQKNGKRVHHLLCGEPKEDDGEKTERLIPTEFILKRFRAGFDGPIIFLIQACRGNKDDSGCEMYHSTDIAGQNQGGIPLDSGIGSMSLTDQPQGPEGSDSTESGNPSNTQANCASSDSGTVSSEDDYIPMCPLDSVVAFSSADGLKSKTSHWDGAWLLYCFNESVKKFVQERNGKLNILKVLTQANNVVDGMAFRKSRDGFKCIASIQHKLSKDLVLKIKPQKTEDENAAKSQEEDEYAAVERY